MQNLAPTNCRLSVITNEEGGILDDCVVTNGGDHMYEQITPASGHCYTTNHHRPSMSEAYTTVGITGCTTTTTTTTTTFRGVVVNGACKYADMEHFNEQLAAFDGDVAMEYFHEQQLIALQGSTLSTPAATRMRRVCHDTHPRCVLACLLAQAAARQPP